MNPADSGRPDLVGGSAYETWALTLKAWGTDPTTPLAHLPLLDAAVLSQATFNRLFSRIDDAMTAMMQAWQVTFVASIEAAATPHDLAVALVAARRALARRVQLARHPGLPTEVQDVLEKDTARALDEVQRQLEESVRRPSRLGRVDNASTEMMLRALRDNPLTRAMDLGANGDAGPTPLVVAPTRVTTGPVPRHPSSSQAPAPRWANRVIRPPT